MRRFDSGGPLHMSKEPYDARRKARLLLRDVRWVPAAGLNLSHDHEQAASDIAIALRAAYAAGEAELMKALRALVAAVDNAMPAINGCITTSRVHGVPYQGPSIVPELDAARALLDACRDTESRQPEPLPNTEEGKI